jgi:hypothetical protein
VSVEDCELRPRGFSQPRAALVFSTGSLLGTISSHTLGRVLCSSYCGIESICGTLIEATGRVTVRGRKGGREGGREKERKDLVTQIIPPATHLRR